MEPFSTQFMCIFPQIENSTTSDKDGCHLNDDDTMVLVWLPITNSSRYASTVNRFQMTDIQTQTFQWPMPIVAMQTQHYMKCETQLVSNHLQEFIYGH